MERFSYIFRKKDKVYHNYFPSLFPKIFRYVPERVDTLFFPVCLLKKFQEMQKSLSPRFGTLVP